MRFIAIAKQSIFSRSTVAAICVFRICIITRACAPFVSESAMAPTYKIIYFNVTALGESCRMLLKYANIDFEDERIETDDWPNHKASKLVTIKIH